MAFRNADLVYLTSNYYAPLVWKNKNIMGSCYNFFPGTVLLGKFMGL